MANSLPAESRPRHELHLWVLIALAALVVFLYIVFWRTKAAAEPMGKLHPDAGQIVGDVRFEPLVDAKSPLALDDLKGRVSLINFWGPWCGYCRQEFPHLIAIEGQFHRNADFQIVSISCPAEPTDSPDALRQQSEEYVRHVDAPFPVYCLPAKGTGADMALLQGTELDVGFPTTIIVDRQGVVRGKWQGYQRGYERAMADLVAELLAHS